MISCEAVPPVVIDETLIRIILTPEHVKDGKIHYSAIQAEHLQKNGCSLTRKLYVSKKVLANVLDGLTGKGKNSFHAFALITCQVVHSFKYKDGRQVLYVVADPTDENPAHANMFFVNKSYKKSEWKEIRERLIKDFNSIEKIDEIFISQVP